MKLQKKTATSGHQLSQALAGLLVACSLGLTGCSDPAAFQVNEAYIRAVEFKSDVSKPQVRENVEVTLGDAQIKNVSEVLEGLYGTRTILICLVVWDSIISLASGN